MIVAEDYTREVKRRKGDDVPSATTGDVCSAEVAMQFVDKLLVQ